MYRHVEIRKKKDANTKHINSRWSTLQDRITRHKEEYTTMINEENITILTVHVPSNEASKHTNQKEWQN